MRHLYLFLLYALGSIAQNHVPNNAEIINRGDLNLNTVIAPNKWTTATSAPTGNFSNYGAGRFTNNGTALTINTTNTRWIEGYVKHYAISGSTSHVYPVGSNMLSEPLFLSTTGETAGQTIAVAWIDGSYNTGSPGSGIVSVSAKGRWSWVASATPNVVVSVKLPATLQGGTVSKSYLRLVGWNGTNWINLSASAPYNSGSDSNGVLSGIVSTAITAVGIGSTTTISGFKNAGIATVETPQTTPRYFKIYPNPARSKTVTLDYDLTYEGKADVVIFDASGKTVFRTDADVMSGKNTKTIDIHQLPSGLFTVQLLNTYGEALIQAQKLMIP